MRANVFLILAKSHQMYLIFYEVTVISFYKNNLYCHLLNRLNKWVIQ